MAERGIAAGLCQCGCGKKTTIAKKDDPRRGWIKGQPKPFLKMHQARQRLMPFDQAREFVRALSLNSVTEWHAYCKSGKKPKTLPTAPYRIYGKEWVGWGDFLGN
jgi:hypothetical protein